MPAGSIRTLSCCRCPRAAAKGCAAGTTGWSARCALLPDRGERYVERPDDARRVEGEPGFPAEVRAEALGDHARAEASAPRLRHRGPAALLPAQKQLRVGGAAAQRPF